MLRLRALLPLAALAGLSGCVNLCEHSFWNSLNPFKGNGNGCCNPCASNGCYTTTSGSPLVYEGPIIAAPVNQSFTNPEQMPAPRLVTPPNNARPVPFVPEKP
jgi:hypothetical protein